MNRNDKISKIVLSIHSIHKVIKLDTTEMELQSGTLYGMRTNYPIVDAVGLLQDNKGVDWYLSKFHYKRMMNIEVYATCFTGLPRMRKYNATSQFSPTTKICIRVTIMLYCCTFHQWKFVFQQAKERMKLMV